MFKASSQRNQDPEQLDSQAIYPNRMPNLRQLQVYHMLWKKSPKSNIVLLSLCFFYSRISFFLYVIMFEHKKILNSICN